MDYYSDRQVLSPFEGLVKDSSWIAVRLAVVLAFLIGMPMLAVPRVQEALGEVFAPDEEPLEEPIDDSSQIDLRPADELDQIVRQEPIESLAELEVVGGDLSTDVAPASEIEQCKQRLIDLGATYMVLERVGVDGSRYRFTCQLPVAAGSPYRRKLYAIDADPVQAMAKVQREIETESQASSGGDRLPRPTVKLR